MSAEEIDLFNWRIDQLHQMVVDLAVHVGHYDLANEMNRFHNENVVPEVNRIIEGYSDDA
jgi:hypothetical protein